MELTVEYIPALIVAKDKYGKYVKISEANKDEIYYCPVCNGEVKARAIGSDKVQPHFYHITESNCNNESILHWMFKNWLFEKGSMFKIGDDEFSVLNFEIEKLIDTPFGEYRPDLFIQTEKEEFFFEINYSSGKDKTFSDKWSYLGKRVIEVNVKELINCELYDKVPKFNTIFENGEYTKDYKSYEKKDKYLEFKNFIVDSKKEEQIKQLVSCYDWFWREIKDGSNENIKICVNEMEYNDALICTKFLKKIKCHDKFDLCKKEISNRLLKEFNSLVDDKNYTCEIKQISAQIYDLIIYTRINNVKIYSDILSIRTYDGLIERDKIIEAYNLQYDSVKKIVKNIFNKIEKLNKFNLEEEKFETSINIFRSSYESNYKIYFMVNVFNEDRWVRCYNERYFGEDISIIKKQVISSFISQKEQMIKDKKNKELMDIILKKTEKQIRDEYFPNISKKMKIKLSKKDRTISFLYDDILVERYREWNMLEFNEKEILKSFEDIENRLNFVSPYIEKINSCKNNFWESSYDIQQEKIKISIKGEPRGVQYINISGYDTELDLIELLEEEMTNLLYPPISWNNDYITIINRKES